MASNFEIPGLSVPLLMTEDSRPLVPVSLLLTIHVSGVKTEKWLKPKNSQAHVPFATRAMMSFHPERSGVKEQTASEYKWEDSFNLLDPLATLVKLVGLNITLVGIYFFGGIKA